MMAAAPDDKSEKPATFPWLKDKVLGTGGFGTVTLWRHNDTGETIGNIAQAYENCFLVCLKVVYSTNVCGIEK